jgi:hypothetical protein
LAVEHLLDHLEAVHELAEFDEPAISNRVSAIALHSAASGLVGTGRRACRYQ